MLQPLSTCKVCGGFLPPRVVACPHCDPVPVQNGVPVWARRLCSTLMLTAGSGLLMTTLMACYGLPPECEPSEGDADGDCYNDSETLCVDACDNREAYLEESCTFETNQACLDACSDLNGRFGEEVDAVLLTCIQSDRLCDHTLSECIVRRLHNEPIALPTTLSGTGFNDNDGMSVRAAWLTRVGEERSFLSEPVAIDAGAFTLTWEPPPVDWVLNAPLLMYMIDVDGDGVCNIDVDILGNVVAEPDGDFLEPGYRGAVDPTSNGGLERHCDYFNSE